MIWNAYVGSAKAFGWVAGRTIGPIIYREKEIRRVGRWARHGAAVALGFILCICPLLLAQSVTPQEFRNLERRVQKVESVIDRIDDPDGLLRMNAKRLAAIEDKQQSQRVEQIQQSAEIKALRQSVEDLPRQLGTIVAIIVGVLQTIVWIIPKIRSIAGTDTGEQRHI